MTVADIFSKSALPRLETEILVSFLLKKEREFLLTHPETRVTAAVFKSFRALAKKRLQNWPIAYLTGHKEFYGRDFKVSPAVLVPRPETELMVEEVLAAAQAGADLIVDVGTGSGAIIVSVADELRRLAPTRYENIDFAAVDISPAALKIAKANAKRYSLPIRFYQGDLLAPLKLNMKKPLGHLVIAANLPYLTPAQTKGSPSIKREPRLALDGGADGLKYYKKLFQQILEAELTTADISIFCEINPGQRNAGMKLAKKYFPAAKIEAKKDLAKKYRLLKIDIKN